MAGLGELVVGPAKGGGRISQLGPLVVEIVRELTDADLPLLANPPPMGTKPPTVKRLSHAHHALARELARGASNVEAGLIAGYSESRVSILQDDPAFQELICYYSTQRELVFIDVLERMKALGLTTLEEIANRMEEAPEKFSPRELMELTELLLVKGRTGPGGGAGGQSTGGPAPAVSVNVQFVTADHRQTIEGEVQR